MTMHLLTARLSVAIFVLALAAASIAQEAVPDGGAQPKSNASIEKAKLEISRPLAHLKLSPEQKVQIKQILSTRTLNEKTYRSTNKGESS